MREEIKLRSAPGTKIRFLTEDGYLLIDEHGNEEKIKTYQSPIKERINKDGSKSVRINLNLLEAPK